jgi:hypothetical protein
MRWELGCVVLHYFNNNSTNIAHKDDDNFMMVSQIGTVEYRLQINFLVQFELFFLEYCKYL